MDANGVIGWTPSIAQVPSTNVFTTMVTDSNPSAVNLGHLSATNSFVVVVFHPCCGPVLPPPDVTIQELTTLRVTNPVVSADPLPELGLTYVLLTAPDGASIDTNGVITWTPSEVQGPSTNVITTLVYDGGSPPLSAQNRFTVFVQEINSAPVLPRLPDVLLLNQQPLLVTNAATDADLPVNTLTYQLLAAPPGAVINTNGLIAWLPSIAQIPSTNVFTTMVTDSNPSAVNLGHLSATNSFVVVVLHTHCCGPLPPPPDVIIQELTTLRVTNAVVSADLPLNTLSYQLLAAPAGAGIDTNGVITWTPSEAQGPGTHVITTVVSDSGSPPLCATNRFTVFVQEINSAPVLPAQESRVLTGCQSLCVTNTAVDADLPLNTLSYQLLAAPAGATVNSNGVLSWTPTPTQVPSTNLFITVASDTNPDAVDAVHLRATNSFAVTVQALPEDLAPLIQNAGFANGQFSVTWTATAGRTYRLQSKELAPGAPWLDMLPEVTASASVASATHNVGTAPARLYRVRVVR